MFFKYFQMVDWPRLSWGLTIKKRDKRVKVYHGNWVETNDDFFTDGAWDGPFNSKSIESSKSFMGFIVKTLESSTIIYTPSHPLERLYFFKTDSDIYLSPSLPLLLQLADLNLHSSYAFYPNDFMDFIRSKSVYHHKLIIEKKEAIEVIHTKNLSIDNTLNITFQEKIQCEAFKSYEEYKNFIINSLKRICENARSPDRKKKYSLISSTSCGYDSPACTALVKEVGCEESLALTQTQDDTYVWDSIDDGSKIVEKLGLKVHRIPRSTHLNRKDIPEAEFFATGYDAMDIVMIGFEDYITEKIFVTGVMGDGIWEKRAKILDPDADFRPDSCGSGLTEFRFRVGFIHMPLPFIGLSAVESINRITNSKEMYPWTLCNDYDRPIPRRMVEEQGVDRNSFGLKKAGSMSFFFSNNVNILKKSMAKKSFEDFERFYQSAKIERSIIYQILIFSFYSLTRICSSIDKFSKKIGVHTEFTKMIPKKFHRAPLRISYFLLWSIPLIKKRYELKDSSPNK